ncbi:TetR/AcrR family transcriptional regulator [Streptomyces sp. 8L]|uniref:TetR/AcrR family transcriptional regulator n=1 Tax=Streptomyces sp. 8L TaxID=2877242 RepID=UPI001CD54779|nr:TetR/AcrR family transcriptional regulator [Streptomyces sp. 8L]MCA1218035.1 TetR/AcrR family transcriptional regulator [Streptomyces sp. 8L]
MSASSLDRNKRAAIFKAALDVVSEVGFDAASVDAVARRSGTSKATLYRHWSDKGALLIEAVKQRSAVPDVTGEYDTFDEAVFNALEVTSRWARENAGLFTAMIQGGHRDAELAAQTQRQIARPHDAIWDGIADRWLPAGSSSTWLRQVCEGFLLQQLLPDAVPPTRPHLRKFIADVVLPLYRTHSVDD